MNLGGGSFFGWQVSRSWYEIPKTRLSRLTSSFGKMALAPERKNEIDVREGKRVQGVPLVEHHKKKCFVASKTPKRLRCCVEASEIMLSGSHKTNYQICGCFMDGFSY